MSDWNGIEKTAGHIRLRVTQPWPRWFEIERTDRDDCRLFGLTEEDARDLHYMLGRALERVAADDAKQK